MDEAEDEFNALRHIVRQKRNRTDWREGRKQGVTDSVLADPAAQIGAQIIGQTFDRASGEIRFGVKQGKRPFPATIQGLLNATASAEP